MEQVTITTYGHACFGLAYEGYRIVLDPYRHGMIPGLTELQLEAEAVYCSHTHDDHAFSEAVTLIDGEGLLPWTVEEFITPHDDCFGTLRGWNVVRIFCFGVCFFQCQLCSSGCFQEIQKFFTENPPHLSVTG